MAAAPVNRKARYRCRREASNHRATHYQMCQTLNIHFSRMRTLPALLGDFILKHSYDYGQLIFDTRMSDIQDIRAAFHLRNQYILKLDV